MSLQTIQALHRAKHAHKQTTRKQIAQVFAHKHNQQRQFLRLKKKRPLWKELAILATTSLSIWGISHVGLNFSAYAQIAEFKTKQLTANLFTKPTPKPVKIMKKVGVKRATIKKTPESVFTSVIGDLKVYPSDNRIVLPRIGKNVPLVEVEAKKNWHALETNIQKGLQNGVVVHPISHHPGNFGNFFLTGHSSYYKWDPGRYKDVFALLHELKEGDTVDVYWSGKKYTYKLDESRVIPPTEVSVLDQPTDQKIITLMTCTPIGTNTNRLIWTGKLIKVE
ncbi:hypothetical protein CSB37_02365 [bacterium DOLZORAL124_38_8]|nr:MAG: hypothetical protein CSB37_02365 [bacterium DOLZORAL124_38_8]